MATFIRIVVFVLCVSLFALGLSFAFPSSYRVERSIEIDAPAEQVFSRIGNLHAWSSWTIWAENDPEMKVNVSEPSTGTGAWQRWDGPESGRGTLTFTHFEPPTRLAYDIVFEDFSMHSTGEMVVEAREGEARVTWIAEGDLGLNPIMRWFGLFFDRMIGSDFEGGLKRLKAVCESVGP